MSRPLEGITVLEMEGLAPGPFCGMLLQDFGASVILVQSPRTLMTPPPSMHRGKKSIVVNLKTKNGQKLIESLITQVDVVIDVFRPGVMEKFGLGPDRLMMLNPALIYARLTGYGQTGSLANKAGHDINYIGTSGVLSVFGRAGERPMFPGNFAADFAGGGLVCAYGILLAIIERYKSGKGQVIDSAMLDGSLYISTMIYGSKNSPLWDKPMGENMLDSGSPFYEVYETKDGKFMAVGAIEPQFYSLFMQGLDLDIDQYTDNYKETKKIFSDVFKTKTRAEWAEIFDNLDACVTPILDMTEIYDHPHNQERGILIPYENQITQDKLNTTNSLPRPAPLLSRTPGIEKIPPSPIKGEHTIEVLMEMGIPPDTIRQYIKEGILYQENIAAL
eukprot:TRINITY_DN3215_c0_g1_i1.p1 TRINITY_DN3215_c0_g1~~TRINITY_DN3215_c0_g1_i1.p1  ORF type:complete len:389 (+),score=66.20 TRINITY_DN3215_c0_g1_i1:327-1493(+)